MKYDKQRSYKYGIVSLLFHIYEVWRILIPVIQERNTLLP